MLRFAALAFVAAGTCVSSVAADPAKPPPALVEVRAAFAKAVSANDVKAAAALTSFPLKNVVFKQPPTVSRAGFAKLFADYRDMKDCIRTEPLEADKAEWAINCNGNVLYFAMRGGRWLHTKYENINE